VTAVDVPEIALFRPWQLAYETHYGFRPELRSSDGALSTLTFRREPNELDLFRRMVGTMARFAHKPRLTEHVRSLGYGWDEDGLILTVPSPGAFRRRMSELGFEASGFIPSVVVLGALDIPLGSWLLELTQGTLPIQLGTAELYARVHGSRAGGRTRGRLIHHLLSVLHDMSKHVLPLHLAPRTKLLELGRRVMLAMGPLRRLFARELGWARLLGSVPKQWLAPVALLTFYENDLVDYCHSVWNAIEDPEDFGPTFTRSRHYDQLEDVLSRRLRHATAYGLPSSEAPPRPYARFEIDGPSSLPTELRP
jgi:hypothetical protein